jgi:hypothetical protein
MMGLKRYRQALLAMLMCGTLVAAFAPAVSQAEPPPGAGKPVHVCPGPRPKDSALCHSFFLGNDDGTPRLATAPNGYAPADLRAAYNVSANVPDPGPVIAIVDSFGYPNAERDLATYRAQFGLQPCTTANGCFRKVNQNGGNTYPRMDLAWAQESALDLDMASAMCPTCQLLLVEADTNSYQNLAAAVDQAAKLGAHVISNSYGGAESATVPEAAYNKPGVAITASSGDRGYGVQFPASSPHVTAVGGTSLKRDGTPRGWSETVWSGAGSGCSAVYPKPAWQTDSGCPRRTVADVSAVADPQTGVAVYGPVNAGKAGWMKFGGTSVAAPIIAGIYGANNGKVSYASDPYAHTTSLFDVTAGNNGTCDTTYPYLCTAGTAYDGPTGLGTPNGTPAFGSAL